MSRLTRNFRTPESRLRALAFNLSRELGHCESARQNINYSLTGKRRTREMSLTELTVLTEWLDNELTKARRPAPYTAEELAVICNASSVEELLGL